MNMIFGTNKSMVSGKGIQQEAIYRKVIGKTAIWYYAINKPNQADYVFASVRNKEGFGGAEMDFELEDGTVDKVKGPWMGAASSMKKDSKVDITDKHLISYVICESYSYPNGHHENGSCINVIESRMNELMSFETPDIAAEKISIERDDLSSVFLIMVSEGGGNSGYKKLRGKLMFKVEGKNND